MLIQAQQANSLILFFNGWGMEQSIVEHLSDSRFDVMMFNQYHQTDRQDMTALKKYDKYYLIAWSMGVWATALYPFLKDYTFEKSIAINGTRQPIDDKEGIPVSIFETTLNTLNIKNKEKFDSRLFPSKKDLAYFKSLKQERTLDNQKEELQYIYDKAIHSSNTFEFTDAYIGKYDLIFPYKNQLNHWRKENYKIKEWSHCPFFEFKSWSEIINLSDNE